MISLTRRRFLQFALALNAFSLPRISTATAPASLRFGPPSPFDFDVLKTMAREYAAREYLAPPHPDPAIVQQIDYDAHGKLTYRKEGALWAHSGGAYPITFQHVGKFFPKTVRMNVVANGMAREIVYDPNLFNGGPDHVASKLAPEPSAFAGFWVHERRDGPDWKKFEPWATFLGASYFRGVGALGQVGLSARGIALAPGTANPEEFPDFISFWFEGSSKADDPVVVYALLDGPSLTGAYRFLLHRTKGVVMDIEANLFLRKDIERLGIAPLTSMHWFSETTKVAGIDWRPEVHDSDGLAIWNGNGEHIWRSLNNPPRIMVSSFVDQTPRGFGLLQRDRLFDHYLDGVRYHLRPSAWVEPLGNWGAGSVQLTEIPTDDEIHDNIVAMWVPAEPATAGKTYEYKYRLHWLADEPYPSPLARVVATRLGRGGQPGKPRPKGVYKFVVEFAGKSLEPLWGKSVKASPVISASHGKIQDAFIEPVPTERRWRAVFDVIPEGTEPVELRLYIEGNGEALTETWLYQLVTPNG